MNKKQAGRKFVGVDLKTKNSKFFEALHLSLKWNRRIRIEGHGIYELRKCKTSGFDVVKGKKEKSRSYEKVYFIPDKALKEYVNN